MWPHRNVYLVISESNGSPSVLTARGSKSAAQRVVNEMKRAVPSVYCEERDHYWKRIYGHAWTMDAHRDLTYSLAPSERW